MLVQNQLSSRLQRPLILFILIRCNHRLDHRYRLLRLVNFNAGETVTRKIIIQILKIKNGYSI